MDFEIASGRLPVMALAYPQFPVMPVDEKCNQQEFA
jgi:hypothetical protein